MQTPTYEDVRAARERIAAHLKPTLLHEWPLLSARLGFRFLLKHENHLPTGAFKVRGGINLVSQLSEDERRRGIIGCSTGNHGQSLAYAARTFGVSCRIVVPAGNNPGKNGSIRALGAQLDEHGRDFDAAKAYCEELTAAHGHRYVHSANEPLLIAGVGTIADEIFDELPDPDVIIAPVGLGSGICGTAIVAAARNPATRVIGVQSTGATAVHDSWRTGRPVSYESIDTFAEGLATRSSAELTLQIIRRHVEEFVLVTDDELREAMRWILEDAHNLAEPAGAATTAAAWQMRESLRGLTVVGILSGGNCDPRVLSDVLRPV